MTLIYRQGNREISRIIRTSGGSCIAGVLLWSTFLCFVQSMQRFVTRALFKMAAPFDILSVWSDMVMAEMVMSRNGSGPKMNIWLLTHLFLSLRRYQSSTDTTQTIEK